jgi:hypothetical protein
VTSYTRTLKAQYARGECDLILTTEVERTTDSETLAERPLCWIGAPDGSAWRQRPLRLAFGRFCTFRPRVIAALDSVGIPWDMVVETESDRTIEATVSADLAVNAMIEGTEPVHLRQIDHGDTLPNLGAQMINLYGADKARSQIVENLAGLVRRSFSSIAVPSLQAAG